MVCRLLLPTWLAIVCFSAGTAHADKIDSLSRTLRSSNHMKSRVAAAVALGKSKNTRALVPLIQGLDDPSHVVRAVAATALGQLGNARAIPSLERAAADVQGVVGRRARTALRNLRAAEHVAADSSPPVAPAVDSRAPSVQLRVAITSTADETRGSKRRRQARSRRVRQILTQQLDTDPTVVVTTTPSTEDDVGYTLDVAITKMNRRVRGPYVEIECEIRVAVSTARGQMLSFVTGGAVTKVPRHSYRSKYLQQFRREALANAVQGLHGDLMRFLQRVQRTT